MAYVVSRRRRTWLASSILAASLLSAGVLGLNSVAGQPGGTSAPPAEKEAVVHAQNLSAAFRNAAEAVLPTVVTVSTRTNAQRVNGAQRGENPFKGTPFEDFFNGREGMFRTEPWSVPERSGVGSGVIIDSSGVVLTNNHVVADADEVVVRLADGREFKAAEIKTDPRTDLAVLRIADAGELPAARMGDSDKMEIGDWVIAVGNPFELESTVSAGIISGKGRVLGGIERAKFLQTDAAINPGNSGGPLVNLDGEVVGINTAIATNNGGYQGIGFAIPANLARWVTTQLVETGQVERAYLGVGIEEINSQLARQFGVRPNDGVLVSEVFPGSPAAEAGFEEADLITKFAGKPVRSPRELQELVERAPLDSQQPVDIVRAGESMRLEVTMKSLPSEFGVARRGRHPAEGDGGATESASDNALGVEVTDLEPNVAEQLGYADYSGVLVSEVDPTGVAYRAGVREGMLIMRIGKRAVESAADFERVMQDESLEDGVLLHVRTQAGSRFLVIQRS